MFDSVDPKQRLASIEDGILQYWKEEDTFKRSLRLRQRSSHDPLDNPGDDTSNPQDSEYSFFDGPPFATGLPHYGHLLAGTIKDVIPRYQTMRGKHVQRRFGWDCHGLPIENIIEKEHNITDHKQIEEMGIDKFNDLCRAAVQRYTAEWKTVVERMGRWVDMDWDYRTMDPPYMESIWWVFHQLYKKELIFEGFKAMHICPRCETPLSNFEVTQGYADRTDMSVIMTFPLVDDPNTVLLAWTTTPWSLPGNFWLAVGDHIDYVRVKIEGDEREYVLAKRLVEKVMKDHEYETIGSVDAKDLVGKKYEPLFPYFVDVIDPNTKDTDSPQTFGERVNKVVMYDDVAVSDEDGTGIVHITSCLGEDSYAVAVHEGVGVNHHLGIDGVFFDEVTDFAGMRAKPEGDDPMATDKAIIANLKERNRHFASYTYNHSYPHCWRCDSPLLNYATSSWFVSVEKIKEKMLQNNAKTHWVPGHIRDGRFGKWLDGARDWAISRNRYWGTPLPIWRCENTDDIEVIGSRDALMTQKKIRFTKLTCLRHGESEGNLIPLYQGVAPGTDLTDNGKDQAVSAADLLSGKNGKLKIENGELHSVDIIYCSPLARTQQTAEIIAKETGAEVIVDERLKETQFGEYEGKTIDFTDLAFLKAKRAHKMKENSVESIYHFPGMETWDETNDRIQNFLEDILPKHRSQHVLVVSHADPINVIKHFFTGEDAVKISHQPYPKYCEPFTYFWDHDRQAQMDLHKDTVDNLRWCGSPSDQSVAVTMVRHGETDWNRDEKLQGQSDPSLNDTGKQQVQALAQSINADDYDCIISSDLKRCKESAEILAKELNLPYEEQWEELRERHFGDWEQRNYEEILAENPPPSESQDSFSFHTAHPHGGESLSEFLQRAERAYTKLLTEQAGKRVLLVTHGGIMRALRTVTENLTFAEAQAWTPENSEVYSCTLNPLLERIPEVLDCWFESGSMPYAQSHFPFENQQLVTSNQQLPPGFPADFIAENLDQTRGWFYTLMVLSTALFDEPAFMNCICGGMILAEDGKKMSKRLKNYPDPMELMQKYGADAMRFALMHSPVVRAETLRFSERAVEETMRNVLLPLWNTYSFFVTYANAAQFEPIDTRRHSSHPLDKWILAEVQDLTNRMTKQLDNYDLSATCGELFDTIDALTNWYVRLSRRRFAGKGVEDGASELMHLNVTKEDQLDALHTLYDVLITLSQLLAPFCPFITEAIYLNLVAEDHASIHLTDWPAVRELSKDEEVLLAKTRQQRTIVSLGLSIRGEQKIKARQPLQSATIAVPEALQKGAAFSSEDLHVIQQELNVKELQFTADPGELAEAYAQVDARKVGPRMGKRVQEIIQAGKNGDFTENEDGTVSILDETLSSDEVAIVYRGKEGQNAAADKGIVVSMDTEITDALKAEGCARDLIRTVQRLRKDSGLEFTDKITLQIDGADDVLKEHSDLIEHETNATFGENDGEKNDVELDDTKVSVQFKRS